MHWPQQEVSNASVLNAKCQEAKLSIATIYERALSVDSHYLAGKTHRELFSEFYQDLLQEPLEEALAVQPQPPASVLLFQQMMRDITTAGGVGVDPIQQVGLTRWLLPSHVAELTPCCLLYHDESCCHLYEYYYHYYQYDTIQNVCQQG